MRILILCSYCFFLISCNSSYRTDEQRVALAGGIYFHLIPQIPFENGLQLSQSASVTYQDQSHDLIFQTEILNDRLTMVGLTPTGTRLFTILLQQGQIDANGLSAMVDKIKPQYLLADLQLSLWPVNEVALALDGAEVIQTSALKRTIVRDGEAIVTIEYSETPAYHGRIHFRHHLRGYSLQIEPISVQSKKKTAAEE